MDGNNNNSGNKSNSTEEPGLKVNDDKPTATSASKEDPANEEVKQEDVEKEECNADKEADAEKDEETENDKEEHEQENDEVINSSEESSVSSKAAGPGGVILENLQTSNKPKITRK